MSIGTWKRGTIASAIVLAFLLVLGLLVGPSTPQASAPAGATEINVLAAGGGCDKIAVASAALRAKGFADAQFVVGNDNINWESPEANERGESSFASETARTAEDLVAQLEADDETSQAALNALLEQSGARQELVLDPSNWVPAQLLVPSVLDGNTAYKGGEAVPAGSRESAEGDVVWIFIDPDKCVRVTPDATDDGIIPPEVAEDVTTAHRAGCGNPQLVLPRPAAPPTVAPPPPGGPTVTTSPPSGGKDHTKASPEVLVQTGPEPRRAPAPSPPPSGGGGSGGGGSSGPPTNPDSGPGAGGTVSPPPTHAPPPAPPTTSSPGGRVDPP
ncbi:hypothetical protein DYH10_03695 [Candidatus Saccharibacteria bacterium CPR2]|nr:hypothetical protein [Candidatus Saccharibacteria bacterium CPR2]